MAIKTVRIGSDDNGNVSWEYDYDDTIPAVTAFRCVNNSAQPAHGKMWTQQNPSRTFERTTPPGVTDSIAVSTQANQRLGLTFINGRVANLEGEFTWPYAG